MGERKGTNKYYPPDFDPKKHFNLDKYHGTHALRERAKKINQGILVIRFEMPYNIWCGGCGIHIAMGVRYNAEKSREGSYYSTPIWKFRMKCHLCDNYFEIKTDPANHDYVIISGARRKEQRWDPKENEQILMEDKNDIKKMATDAMFKLEHATEDKAKIKTATPGIAEITEIQQEKKEDYLLNSLARKKFRAERKYLKSEVAKDAALLSRSSLDITLVKEHKDDIKMAKLMKYKAVESFDEKQQHKREEIINRSLFGPAAPATAGLLSIEAAASSSSSSSSNIVALVSPKNSTQRKEETKKRLQLAASKAKTEEHSTFSSGGGGSAAAAAFGQNKLKTSLDLGIVRKQNTDQRNEKLKQTRDSCDGIGSISDNITQENADCDSVLAKETDTNSSSQSTQSGGLGSLMANYDSSSSSDSE